MDSFKASICGVETLFVLRQFQNKQFLVITQYGKMANIFVVRPEKDMSSMSGISTDNADIQIHFGQDTDELQVAVRRIVLGSGLLRKGRPIILSLALKHIDKAVLDEIISTLKSTFT